MMCWLIFSVLDFLDVAILVLWALLAVVLSRGLFNYLFRGNANGR